jgi:PPM family protein phosphatase
MEDRLPAGPAAQMVARSHVGHVRESNEDNYKIVPELGLIVVADGVGGHAGGEVASALVIENVEREIRAIGAFARAAPSLALTAAIRAANDAVRKTGNDQPALQGMGSTVVSALVIERVAHVAHAGDSRAYRVRDGKIERLTRDHSLVEEYMRENPGATEDDLEGVYKHLVTRAVGAAQSLEVDVNEYECEPGDVLLFCTDGLTGPVEDEAIARLIARAKDLDSAALALVQAALDGGGPDNVTVALAKIG